jgi:hypothetical protein
VLQRVEAHVADQSKDREVHFGPGIWSGLIAVIIGIIPDPAALAIVPALISMTGAIRTLTSRRVERRWPGWIGLVLGAIGLFLASIWILDMGSQIGAWDEPFLETCDVSPFCRSF